MKQFNFNTIENFDEHINQSIPNYDVLIDSIKSIIKYFEVGTSNIYDVGCSTGKLLKSLETKSNLIGYDNSLLLPENDSRFINCNLNDNFKIENASIVLSIFTMQFINPEKRNQYLETIYSGLNENGVLLLCEKIYLDNGFLQEIFTFSHYDQKSKFFTYDEIMKKQTDLRSIMKPMPERELINLLFRIGFKYNTIFWKMFNFIGIICVK